MTYIHKAQRLICIQIMQIIQQHGLTNRLIRNTDITRRPSTVSTGEVVHFLGHSFCRVFLRLDSDTRSSCRQSMTTGRTIKTICTSVLLQTSLRGGNRLQTVWAKVRIHLKYMTSSGLQTLTHMA